METILLSISGLCGITASTIWFYNFAYARGYEDGNHCGISQGLFLAKERENKRLSYKPNKTKLYTQRVKLSYSQ
jgi:hypothetical protein